MPKEIHYTKFETFGIWQENSDGPEVDIVVSFGKTSLLLKDVNDSVLAQWSFPSISMKKLPDGKLFFTPDDEGEEKLYISDSEMVDQLIKVIHQEVPTSKGYITFFFFAIIIISLSFLIYHSKNVLTNIAVSITPLNKTSIFFHDILNSQDLNIGKRCLGSKGQLVLDRLSEQYEEIVSIKVTKSKKMKNFLLPNNHIILTEGFILNIRDPLELEDFLFNANNANRSNIPLKMFFSAQSFPALLRYIAGRVVAWDNLVLNELNIRNIRKYIEPKGSKKLNQTSGLDWVRVQNICNQI